MLRKNNNDATNHDFVFFLTAVEKRWKKKT